jgi:hypothetical protein
MRELDVECLCAPYLFEERPVVGLRKLEYDARDVGETMFLRIERRVLRLLCIGTLQLPARGAQIPEVAPLKVLLGLVEIEGRVEWRIGVALRLPLAESEAERSGIRDRRRIH